MRTNAQPLPFWLAPIPSRFAGLHLSTLEASPESCLPMDQQQAAIDRIKGGWQDSYFFHGTPGSGKTHLAYALYQTVVGAWADHSAQQRLRPYVPHGWHVSATHLLAELTAWERREGDDWPEEPTITLAAIRHAVAEGYRPILLLDELDRVSRTEFRMNSLLAIINAVYEADGQLIATSNLGRDELARKWGEDDAGAIVRRLGQVVEFRVAGASAPKKQPQKTAKKREPWRDLTFATPTTTAPMKAGKK